MKQEVKKADDKGNKGNNISPQEELNACSPVFSGVIKHFKDSGVSECQKLKCRDFKTLLPKDPRDIRVYNLQAYQKCINAKSH